MMHFFQLIVQVPCSCVHCSVQLLVTDTLHCASSKCMSLISLISCAAHQLGVLPASQCNTHFDPLRELPAVHINPALHCSIRPNLARSHPPPKRLCLLLARGGIHSDIHWCPQALFSTFTNASTFIRLSCINLLLLQLAVSSHSCRPWHRQPEGAHSGEKGHTCLHRTASAVRGVLCVVQCCIIHDVKPILRLQLLPAVLGTSLAAVCCWMLRRCTTGQNSCCAHSWRRPSSLCLQQQSTPAPNQVSQSERMGCLQMWLQWRQQSAA